MILYKEIWLLVWYHRWERFCVTPKENAVIPIVQEFYAIFRDQETRRLYAAIWETIIERRKEEHSPFVKFICIGEWSMKHCISGQKVKVFFPHLVTTLRKKARVPMEVNEQFTRPAKSLIGDSMYT
ncbi:hypothetical protein PVK06_047091 [Gossypium arboreum]|uniref:Uncharacterized protein n=1 Tax=Gossypium arboreum TaxID=29729 RepID=A0ABR0MEA5_GOSAR|nr:hypothetical protein PVK06_047091 [Gossypium arboreum]